MQLNNRLTCLDRKKLVRLSEPIHHLLIVYKLLVTFLPQSPLQDLLLHGTARLFLPGRYIRPHLNCKSHCPRLLKLIPLSRSYTSTTASPHADTVSVARCWTGKKERFFPQPSRMTILCCSSQQSCPQLFLHGVLHFLPQRNQSPKTNMNHLVCIRYLSDIHKPVQSSLGYDYQHVVLGK